jgi:hypothetical protein
MAQHQHTFLIEPDELTFCAYRQGVLPWARFWTSTKPFGTPWGPYVVQWAITVVMILAPPAGDAFNFGM